MAQLKPPKNAASVKTWMGTKSYINDKDIEGMVAQGYSKDYLAKLAGGTTSARFGPEALKILGVNSVYNYDPSQYNKDYAPFAKGKAKVTTYMSGRNIASSKKTPYSFAADPAAAPPPPAAEAPAPYTPTPLAAQETYVGTTPSFNINMPEAPPPQYTAGGAGAVVDGNVSGFRRKKSSARMAGLTSKGTSQFKIGGQSARSSGLNIGI